MEFVEVHDPEQQRQMLHLLKEGFPGTSFDWTAALKAPPGRTGRGLLMVTDGEPQGILLYFESAQSIGGRERRVVNFSSFYIRPKYRRFAVRMGRIASSDMDAIYTICTPSRASQALGLRAGFRYLTRGSIASIPLINGFATGRGVSVEIYEPTAVAPNYHRTFADHSDARHISLLVRKGERATPVLWMRGLKIRGMQAARLLFTPDHTLLRAALPAIHAHMLRRYGIVGLYLPRIAPLEGLRSVRRRGRGPTVIIKGDVADEDVNLLYSELLYLPL